MLVVQLAVIKDVCCSCSSKCVSSSFSKSMTSRSSSRNNSRKGTSNRNSYSGNIRYLVLVVVEVKEVVLAGVLKEVLVVVRK